MLNTSINNIEESGIREVFKKAMELGSDAINLSIGQPHYQTSLELKKLAKTAIDDNYNTYLPTLGYTPLRKKIANKLKEKNSIDATYVDIIITSGVSGALFLLFATLIEEGDEIILPDPYFVMYEQLAKYFKAKIVLHNTYPDFRLKAEKIESLISTKTKFLLINTPNNPTGIVYSEDELKELAQIAKKHNLLIISDEIYESFDYNKQFFSIGSIYNNTVTLNGYSKNLSITGWRLGYAHGPKRIVEAMNKLQMYSFVCAPSVAQKAVADLDENKLKVFDYTLNRDLIVNKLKDKFEIVVPEGAFYAFIKIPVNIENFFEKLEESKLLIVPGKVFSSRNEYFRLSFAVDTNTLMEGIEILKSIN